MHLKYEFLFVFLLQVFQNKGRDHKINAPDLLYKPVQVRPGEMTGDLQQEVDIGHRGDAETIGTLVGNEVVGIVLRVVV